MALLFLMEATIQKYRNCLCVLLWSKIFRYFKRVQSCLLLLFWMVVVKNECSLLDHGTTTLESTLYLQKHPSRAILRKRCSENMQQTCRRTPMRKCDFNKVANQLYWNHTSAWVFFSKFATNFQNVFFRRTPLEGCFCIFHICWMSTAFALVKNDVLLLVPTGKVLELGFSKLLIKAWLSVERLFPV